MDNTECKIDANISENKSGDGMRLKMRMKGKGCKNLNLDKSLKGGEF